ncbi:hypothetical protein ASC80_18710 [Afipia sp. Root123D2]|uniref:hypothetical protein n=1 Tax=Afipia sp. Root123D2 TaxID=1736436 RepID=UPI0006F3C081|nr:hypothetical protein [Afipia sp. Root123D2]KQW19414.1 hypothetical protein ASC80_18710 [Afipia sp. Root123D2]
MARRGWIAASIVIATLFTLAATGSALRKPVTQGFDEVAHLSYAATLQASPWPFWPGFARMHLIDPATFEFTAEQNYLNHPPFYYAVVAAIAPAIAGHPSALMPARLINVAMALAGVIALLVLGRRMRLAPLEFYAFAVMIATVPVLSPLAGAVNNDNLCIATGAIGMLGLYDYARTRATVPLLLACAGMIVASAAKLTGLLLVGTTFALTMAMIACDHPAHRRHLVIALAGLMIAAAPYLVFLAQYGSPAPDTAAQAEMVRSSARAAGWADQPRLTLPAYIAFFLKTMLLEWMPTLRPRGALHYVLLICPAIVMLTSLAGTALSLRAVVRRESTPADLVIAAGALATALTLAAHIMFSYQRHVQTGWLMDAYPRYYLPLLALLPMAALRFASAIRTDRARPALLALLIASPMIFQAFGEPPG